MNKQLSKEKMENKILQLVNEAEAFLKWSEKLLDLYEQENLKESYRENPMKQYSIFYKNPVTKLITLHQILYFQEVMLILKTLFEKTKPFKEISFEYYINNYGAQIKGKQKLRQEFNKIRDKYDNSSLKKFRNHLFAHRDVKYGGDPDIDFLNPVERGHINSAFEVIKDLKKFTSDNNFSSPRNINTEEFSEPFDLFYNYCKYMYKKNKKIKEEK